MKDEPGLTALEALGIAIRAEQDSRNVYDELADRSDQEHISRLFRRLAEDEGQHLRFLQERYKELAGSVPLKLPPSGLPEKLATPERRRNASLEAVLEMAIDEEKRSRDLYLRAATETRDPSGQRMFRYLADMEYEHWMELEHERRMLERYPNHARRGNTPWMPEAMLHGNGSRGGE
jgi:rubrerythrin